VVEKIREEEEGRRKEVGKRRRQWKEEMSKEQR